METSALTKVPSPLPMYIDGREYFPDGRSTQELLDPSTGETLTHAYVGEGSDVDDAVEAAGRALRSRDWSEMGPHDRSALLHRIADLIEEEAAELAELETRNNGKPIERSEGDIAFAARIFRYYAGAPTRLVGTVIPVGPNVHAYRVLEPVGVAALILPWNFPILTAAFKLAPALAAGCTTVIKPAPITPVTAVKLAELCTQAGVPAGVVNVVTGDAEVGRALTSHPLVNKVSFTGSSEVGRTIMRQASDDFTRLTLELGGKNANIIFDDADLTAAVPTAVRAALNHSGQMCTAGSRILVQRGILDEVVGRLKDEVAGLKIGNGLSRGVTIGPVASREHQERVLAYISLGKKEGAQLVHGGGVPDQPGFFVEPTVFVDVRAGMKIEQEEIFGPVVTVIPFEDESEALEIANGTAYGLASAVWTQDMSRAHRMTRTLRSGTVWVNCYNVFDAQVGFGGVKDSGIGRDLGEEALLGFLEPKSIIMSV